MPETLQNLVSQPPLTTSIVDKSGVLTKEWAIWFRDIYRRVAYKGGNAIDDTKDVLNETIDTLGEAIIQILKNIVDIAKNAADILFLEYRVFGQDRPGQYGESAGYLTGDYIVNPDDPQHYFRATEDIGAPAGVFDLLKWQEMSLREAFIYSDAIQLELAGKGAAATVSSGSLSDSFNISGLTNPGPGQYRLTLAQSTILGVDVTLDGFLSSSHYFSTAGLFQVDVRAAGTGMIDILVSKVTVTTVSNLAIDFGAGTFTDNPQSTIVLTPTNLAAGDTVSVAISIMDGDLPPA